MTVLMNANDTNYAISYRWTEKSITQFKAKLSKKMYVGHYEGCTPITLTALSLPCNCELIA